MKLLGLCLFLLCAVQAEEVNGSPVACRVQAVEGSIEKGPVMTHHGSGVAIGSREILTAAHVVKASGAKCRVEFGGRWIDCTLVGVDLANDLALLTAGEDLANFARLAEDKDYGLYMVASGEKRPVNVSAGAISFAKANFGDMAHGKSGGAVLDMSGRLVGIVQGGEPLKKDSELMRPDVTWFVGTIEIRKFLQRVSAKKF